MENSRVTMPLTVVLLASCGQMSLKGSTDGTAPRGDSSSSSSGETSASSESAHEKFAVLEVTIGMPIDGLADFTCAKQKAGGDLEDTHCVKFLDSRCSGLAANLGELRYGEDAPPGCFLDYSNSATYLDATLLQTPNSNDSTDRSQRNPRKPLANLHVVGTQSRPSRIYRIWYTFAPDDLAEDSKLYAAMVAKYGEPSYKNPPNEMRWALDNKKLDADCVENRHCQIVVEDSKFEALEERKQEEADDHARRQDAPAPKL
jgi:hypothetical protein